MNDVTVTAGMQPHAGLMTILAHPDDEAFGVAGTLARATQAGHPAAVVCATRGEAGEIADSALATRENLGQVREQELRDACVAVGEHDVTFLDYVDGRLAADDWDEAVGRIVRHIRRFRPAVVVTFAANGVYGHPDHMAIHRLTLAAVEAASDAGQYMEHGGENARAHRVRKVCHSAPSRERLVRMRADAQRQGQDFLPGGDAASIPFEEMGTPEGEITTRLVLSDAEWAAKQRAMSAHATQQPVDSPWITGKGDDLRGEYGVETFVLAPLPISDRVYPTPENDLFAALWHGRDSLFAARSTHPNVDWHGLRGAHTRVSDARGDSVTCRLKSPQCVNWMVRASDAG